MDVCASYALQIKDRGLTLAVSAGPDLPAVDADPERVRQVLVNLVDNAVKYNRRAGRLEITASAGSESLEIEVRDTGEGIPPENLDSLFQRFQRLPAASPETAKVKGIGLGLAISHGLARAMGGDLRARSEVGVGTVFIFTLPTSTSHPLGKEA